LIIGLALLEFAAPTSSKRKSAQIDSGFLGNWRLDVSTSDFGPNPKPRMGQVNWGEHGWTLALVFADGQMFTDGIATDAACVYIGNLPLTCEYEVVTTRHVRLVMKEGKNVIRIGDIELLDNGTTQTIHQVRPPNESPYVEKTIWVKQK